MKDWMLTLVITGIGGLVNVGINMLIYAMYMGRHLEKVEKCNRMTEEHEDKIGRIQEKIAAITGIANGVPLRRRITDKGD